MRLYYSICAIFLSQLNLNALSTIRLTKRALPDWTTIGANDWTATGVVVPEPTPDSAAIRIAIRIRSTV